MLAEFLGDISVMWEHGVDKKDVISCIIKNSPGVYDVMDLWVWLLQVGCKSWNN